MSKRVAIAFLAVLVASAAGPALGGEPELSPYLAAGKLLFEETAGDVGCQACHGFDATGTDIAPDIRGKDETAIIQNLMINDNMTFLALSTEDIEQIAAWLAYLKDNPLR
jgi:cytochrome c553